MFRHEPPCQKSTDHGTGDCSYNGTYDDNHFFPMVSICKSEIFQLTKYF